jgi:chromosome segregation ATPase
VATLEDAAENLVVKLRGLEAEIADSDQKLEALRERMEAAKRDLEEDWADLTEAATSLLDTIREEGERLDRQGDETLQAVTDAHNALGENAASAHGEIAEAATELDALGRHATSLEQAVEPLVHDGIEAPAQGLEERARELEQELGRLVDEARGFLTLEVVPALEQVASGVRERCQELQRTLMEDRAQPLQQVFDEWSGHIDEVETYVLEEGYKASHQHAREALDYVAAQWDELAGQRVEEVKQVVTLLEGQLQQFATEMERAGTALTEHGGARLLRELEEAKQAAERAVSGLDGVRRELAARSFMEV